MKVYGKKRNKPVCEEEKRRKSNKKQKRRII
jgi:hypothetical protein